MNCGELRQKIYLFLYGELTRDELEAIYKHLADCHHCEQEKILIGKILETLKNGLGDEPAPQRIRERLFQSLDA